MDCNTARRMLEFAGPLHRELDPPDLQALEAHVAACPDCALLSRQERRDDDEIGRAMRRVDVPDRLRAAILTRLADDRAAERKWRWKSTVLTGVAAAAVVMIAVGGWMLYQQATLRPFDLAQFAEVVKNGRINEKSPAAIENVYKARGIDMKAPAALNYAFLDHHGLAELQGHQVPCLIFIRDDPAANIHAHAKVYVVSDRQFNLKDMPATDARDTDYGEKIEVDHEPGSHFAYVIVYTGENLDWLRRHDAAE
jgi:hypothetical protein